MPQTPPAPLLLPRELLPQTQRRGVTSDITAGRVHELAIQKWFYSHFFVSEGYPVPLVFATPMDAFSVAAELWKAPNNPFKYLLDAKDANGTPLYEPYPANIRYPIISVKRLGWNPRINQSYGIHRYRHAGYPTVNKDVKQNDLGNVIVTRMPVAWDFRYQIDHFCTRPDTQAIFIQTVMRSIVWAAGAIQTWIPVVYPGYFGTGHPMCRLYLDGNIENATPDEPSDAQVEFRTSFTLVLEGYSPDLDQVLWPTLWREIVGANPVSPEDLNTLFANPEVVIDEDLREHNENAVFKTLPDLPPVS